MLPIRCFLFLFSSQIGYLKADPTGIYANSLRPFVKYYETLSYDKEILHQNHQRARRATEEQDKLVQLEFHAHQRTFKMRLTRDTVAFADAFEVVEKGKTSHRDLSFLYSGELQDEETSFCSGSIINGLFEGSIQTKNGTYYVEPVEAYKGHGNSTAHSLIYHENDIDYSVLENTNSSLGLRIHQKLRNWQSETKLKEAAVRRTKRTLDASRTTCLLYLKADHLFCKRFGSVERVIAQIDGLLKAVNSIYEQADFGGIKHINFKVKKLDIFIDEDPLDSMHSTLIGVEKLLELYSEQNWNSYCLSYLLTDRDYSGVLGLAWEGKVGNNGGVCSKYARFQNALNTEASLNTGLVTVQTYGRALTPRLIQITLAHELAHSMGAPHDGGTECKQFDIDNKQGNYLMFPYAVDGNQINNNRFSPCTIDFIGKVLRAKKDQCFVESDHPICGNRIVDEGEECDVGNSNSDPCCFGASDMNGFRCKLKPGKSCSSSQGLCCNHECTYIAKGELCQKEAECTFESYCTGTTSKCSIPSPKPNHTICNFGTKTCLNGLCLQSLCNKYGLEKCDCETSSMREKCQLCCQQPGNVRTCASTSSSVLGRYFNGMQISLPPGSPCGDRQGYCDKFHICRLVDADGPIARLKNSILSFIEIEDIASWMKAKWWLILVIILTLAAVMAGTVFLFGRTLDSEKGSPLTGPPLPTSDYLYQDKSDGRAEEDLRSRSRKTAIQDTKESFLYLEREELFLQSSHVECESRM